MHFIKEKYVKYTLFNANLIEVLLIIKVEMSLFLTEVSANDIWWISFLLNNLNFKYDSFF